MPEKEPERVFVSEEERQRIMEAEERNRSVPDIRIPLGNGKYRFPTPEEERRMGLDREAGDDEDDDEDDEEE